MEIDAIKRINLPDFLLRHYSIQVTDGKVHCPFHPPDENPSLSVYHNDDGTWAWKDFHPDGGHGSIIDFVIVKDGLTVYEAIKKIKKLEGLEDRSAPAPAQGPERKIEKIYDYTDEAGKLIFQKIRNVPKSFAFRRSEGNGWTYRLGGVGLIPYRLAKIKDEQRIFLCEGEKDADLLAGLGYPSTSAPFGAGSWPAVINHYFRGKDVFIIYDRGNETKVQRIAAELSNHAREIFILTIPIDRREADVTDYLSMFKADEEKRNAFEKLISHGIKYEPPKPKGHAPSITLAERGAQTVRVRRINYLWQGVIPTHMSTALTGDPAEGKSLVAIDITARVTSGTPFPAYDEDAPATRGHVFYVTSEGVPEMILVPRLIAAGADLTKVTIIEGVRLKSDEFSMFDVTTHLPKIASRAKDFPELKLIVIDPIASFIPERINTNQMSSVRQMMDRISDLAYQLGIAAVTVMHFSKTVGVKAGQRTAGSGQFGAAVKMSWSVVRREGDPRNVRLLVPQKTNITGASKSLSFSIHEVNFQSPNNPSEIITTAKIEYEKLVDEDPEILISPPAETDNNVASAIKFLRHKLAEGLTLYAKPLIDEAEENGIPKWALYKAKNRLGVEYDKEGQFQGRTFWYLPAEKRS
jgi:putative DNA primase/helicase